MHVRLGHRGHPPGPGSLFCHTYLVWITCLLALPAGCSGRRVQAPQLNPDEAGKQAVADYDRNKDGLLDAGELDQCPGLKCCLTALDTNKDGRLSAQEITDRISTYQASRVGLLAVPCRVTLDGVPLAGATVELIPEKFLGPTVKPAAGVSDGRGQVSLKIEGQDVPGVPCGFYRVSVSKKNADKETLPARYNSRTVLGQELGPDLEGSIQLHLTSS